MKPFIRYTTVLTLGLIAGYLIRDWQARNPASSQAPRCIRVLDGDTIEVAWDGETNKVRLIGIDAPETRRGPKLTTYANKLDMPEDTLRRCGREATGFIEGIVLGEQITLVFPGAEHDAFGRWLAYAEHRGQDLGAALLERGYAWARPEPHPRGKEYEALTEEAKAEKRGLWRLVGR